MIPLFVAGITSTALLAVFCKWAPRWGFVVAPDQRRVHSAATPVGGGICFALATLFALFWVNVDGPRWLADRYSIQGLGLVLAVAGLLDDRLALGALPRLALYLAGGLLLTSQLLEGLHWVHWLLLALAATWVINLVNFMDGLDGFAVSHALCVCVGMTCIAHFVPGTDALVALNLVLVAALAPFFVLNWPPARLFMGDSGSIFLGFYLSAIGLVALRVQLGLGIAWLVMMMPFIVDATLTLADRLLRGFSPLRAHREHAYQRFASRFGSPLPVNLALLAIHGVWQFPCAIWAMSTSYSLWFPVIFSTIPSVLLVVYSRRSS